MLNLVSELWVVVAPLREVEQDLIAVRGEVEAAALVNDRLWELLEPSIPPRPPARGPSGRPPIDDRAALEGISSTCADWSP
ncbi:hypothetical protein [Actinomycetospora lemnae]|uniref:Uncharacterized protein n=1 Tax=Actinomycetospora lemnae TaxID=3019891 RepID=A0ABT5T2E7_9PSEU|nr:hypothetical protein [Actinomycetospora sp. DW7H6]MDD7969297.1 hypothetical protein [Actinomycetospora sp. DW7H6]